VGVLLSAARLAIFHNMRLLLRGVLRCACDARVAGEERVPLRGGVIVAANHLSFADPVVLQVYVPRLLTYLMTERFYRAPVLHGLVKFWGVLVVKERGLHKDTIRAAGELLDGGGAIGIFPEGGISRDGRTRPAQPGVALLAQRSRVPIVPVGLAGTERLLPPDATWPGRAALRAYIGQPIPWDAGGRAALTQRVTEALASCHEQAERL